MTSVELSETSKSATIVSVAEAEPKDHGDLLQNLLSELSSSSPSSSFHLRRRHLSRSDDGDDDANEANIVDSLWNSITRNDKDLFSSMNNNSDGDASLGDTATSRSTSTIGGKTHTSTSTAATFLIPLCWYTALQKIRNDHLPHISPLELHAIASQSIIFAQEEENDGPDDDRSNSSSISDSQEKHLEESCNTAFFFRMLCLLLCVVSLQNCPSPLHNRHKRWQSMLCETIRLFQDLANDIKPQQSGDNTNYNNDTALMLVVRLWVHYLCPTALHVVAQLVVVPNNRQQDIHFDAIFAGLVGTTTTLTGDAFGGGVQNTTTTAIPSFFFHSLQHICSIFTAIPISETTASSYDLMSVWMNPYRRFSYNKQQHHHHIHHQRGSMHAVGCMEDDETMDHEEVAFEIHRHNLSWWINEAHKEDRVTNMDTSWSPIGASVLSMVAFDERASVYHPLFLWKVWFPHATQVMKESGSNDPFSLSFLRSLLEAIPDRVLKIDKSLLQDCSYHKQPDAPLEIIQVLSNRMLVVPNGSTHEASDVQTIRRQHVSQVSGLILSVLNRYDASTQVAIVEKLMEDCPNPGLQARFMDLLRPLVSEPTCQIELWDLLKQQVHQLLRHVDLQSDYHQLSNIQDLILKVEVYVSTLSLIQRLSIVPTTDPGSEASRHIGTTLRHSLLTFHRALLEHLEHRTTKSDPATSSLPDNFYRLNLLDSALENVQRALN